MGLLLRKARLVCLQRIRIELRIAVVASERSGCLRGQLVREG